MDFRAFNSELHFSFILSRWERQSYFPEYLQNFSELKKNVPQVITRSVEQTNADNEIS